MISKAAVAWETEGILNKYIEECGVTCELVSPQMLATPFYKGNIVALVIPTGFGNRLYSSLLPALRSSRERVENFVKKGGRILCYGAITSDSDTYDWLPFECEYTHEFFSAPIKIDKSKEFSDITSDFDENMIDFDGYFTGDIAEDEVIASAKEGRNVIFAKKYGEGYFVLVSTHELPSKEFIRNFCTANVEILF